MLEKMNMQATLSCPDGGHRPSFRSLGTSPFLTWSVENSRKGDTEVEGLVTDHLSPEGPLSQCFKPFVPQK